MCPRCKGCLSRRWCDDTRSEYDYCINCGHRMNQVWFRDEKQARASEPRRCLDCGWRHRDRWEVSTGETKVYTRCYTCRKKQEVQRRRAAV